MSGTTLTAHDLPPGRPSPERAPLMVRLTILIAIIVPLCAIVGIPFMVWGWGFRWTDLGLLLGFYVCTTLGVTVGFHRLFVHRSFDTSIAIKFVLTILGSMAVQGSLFQWVGMHRRHHQFSDTPGDPHTPHHHGSGMAGVLKGFWHAHIGWFFARDPPDLERYTKDLRASRALRVADALFPLWVALGLILPAVLGGLITRQWSGVLSGFAWGGLARVFLVHHVTWSVNSACHLWGWRPFATDDMSRNNPALGLLGLGEGWHNTHHAFPTSARHGLRWWQIDVSYWVIRSLVLLHLAWNLKLPSAEAQERQRS